MIELIIRVARHGRRRRRRIRKVAGSSSRRRSGPSLDMRLLINGKEVTLLLQPDAVGAPILRVVGSQQAADLPSSTMPCCTPHFSTTFGSGLGRVGPHRTRPMCGDILICCVACPPSTFPRLLARSAWMRIASATTSNAWAFFDAATWPKISMSMLLSMPPPMPLLLLPSGVPGERAAFAAAAAARTERGGCHSRTGRVRSPARSSAAIG